MVQTLQKVEVPWLFKLCAVVPEDLNQSLGFSVFFIIISYLHDIFVFCFKITILLTTTETN